MRIRQLEQFIAVADELHFGRAAERLGIAQPPLSRQIKQIEDDLGVLLFHRGRRQVNLTQAGEKLYERALQIVSDLQEAELEVRRIGQGAEGRLRIGFVGSTSFEIVPNILKSFRSHHPSVALGLFPMNNAGLSRAIIRREIDIAIARPNIADAEILSRELIVERLVAAVPDVHPLAARQSLALVDLATVPLILYPEMPRPSFADLVLDLLTANEVEPNERVFTMDVQTAISLVSVQVGCAVVPAAVGNAARLGVRFVPIDDDTAVSPVSVNVRIDEQSIHVKNFVDVALMVSRVM